MSEASVSNKTAVQTKIVQIKQISVLSWTQIQEGANVSSVRIRWSFRRTLNIASGVWLLCLGLWWNIGMGCLLHLWCCARYLLMAVVPQARHLIRNFPPLASWGASLHVASFFPVVPSKHFELPAFPRVTTAEVTTHVLLFQSKKSFLVLPVLLWYTRYTQPLAVCFFKSFQKVLLFSV